MLELKYHDDIDICIIKMVIPYSGILKYLIHTFSISLQRGNFPDNMKIARVIPILTNYDAQEISNYRPEVEGLTTAMNNPRSTIAVFRHLKQIKHLTLLTIQT